MATTPPNKNPVIGIDKKEMLPDTVTVNLYYPIKDDTIADMYDDPALGLTKITMRRPKMAERIKLHKAGNTMSQQERELTLVSEISGIPYAVLATSLDLSDYEMIQEGLGKFSPSDSVLSAG